MAAMDIVELASLMDLNGGADEVVDLRALDYVSRYDEHLMCPICHCPFIRPLRLRCDHVFCQKCLNEAITSTTLDPHSFRCPSCRSHAHEIFSNVPRLLINMCDDIRVRCPYSAEGCKEIMPRGHVQLHVDKYCDSKLMDCPVSTCTEKTRKKNMSPEGKCMHTVLKCEACEEDIVEQNLEEHQNEHCPSLRTNCPDCDALLFVSALEEHVETCPEAIHECQASKYGCSARLKRSELTVHERSCPLITMGPYIEAQNSRIDSLDMTIRQLRQRNEILEDGIANIRSTLVESAQLTPESRTERQTPSGNEIHPHPESGEAEQGDRSSNLSSTTTMTYLLSLHESLREEVSRLSHAITDLDARASMAILNESMRIKEDMAHTSAAINTIRMQIHWLLNPRLQQSHRFASTAASSSSSTSAGQGAGTAAGPSSGPPPARFAYDNEGMPPRRLSDSGREGTKL